MPYYTGSLKYYQAAKSLHDALGSALSNPVDQSCVVPGAIAWDACECGMLAVSVGTIYLSDSFPAEVQNQSGAVPAGTQCEAAWEVAEIIVQLIRCAPAAEGSSLYPACTAQDAAARIMTADAYEIIAGTSLWLCDNRYETIADGLIISADPQGPEGLCVGYELRLLVAFPRG